MELKLRIKMVEQFKDGNVLDGRFLKTGEILIVSEMDKNKIEQSGGLVEVIEQVMPNPLKGLKAEPVEAEKEEKKEIEPRKVGEISTYREEAPAPEPKKPSQGIKRGVHKKQ